VAQHPDLDADYGGVGALVRELHHIALSSSVEQEVVVGFAGEAGQVAAQAIASGDRIGGVGLGDGRRWCQPGFVKGVRDGVWH
jgi:hypothetical protein